MVEGLIHRLEQASEGGLEAAIYLAAAAHLDQTDKGGHPYILHPLRVMLACRTKEQRIVAVLHDVVEDSSVSIDQIRENFGQKIADAVDALTRRDTETYTGFILRCGENELARYVKQRDLEDNMDLDRLGRKPTIEDAQRHKKYSDARNLLSALDRAYFANPHSHTQGQGVE